eukprot:11388550-Alexandrium_andersonii.AAC.1
MAGRPARATLKARWNTWALPEAAAASPLEAGTSLGESPSPGASSASEPDRDDKAPPRIGTGG